MYKAPAPRLQKQLNWPMRAQVGHTSLLAETGYLAQWPRTCLGPKQLPHYMVFVDLILDLLI